MFVEFPMYMFHAEDGTQILVQDETEKTAAEARGFVDFDTSGEGERAANTTPPHNVIEFPKMLFRRGPSGDVQHKSVSDVAEQAIAEVEGWVEDLSAPEPKAIRTPALEDAVNELASEFDAARELNPFTPPSTKGNGKKKAAKKKAPAKKAAKKKASR